MSIRVIGLESVVENLEEIQELFGSNKFKEFIAEKCLDEVKTITNQKIGSLDLYKDGIGALEKDKYVESHHKEVTGKSITIYNDAMLEQDEMTWVSEKTRKRYPNGISIAKIIEWGTGIKGIEADDWQVNVPSPSKHKDGTWTFKRDDNIYKNIAGSSPQLIYLQLEDSVRQKFSSWVDEFLKRRKK